MALFQRRYEEGYDVPGDDVYEEWVQMYHPEHQSPQFSVYSDTSDERNESISIAERQSQLESSVPSGLSVDRTEPASSTPISHTNILPRSCSIVYVCLVLVYTSCSTCWSHVLSLYKCIDIVRDSF